jgi:hypothetical protein
MRRALYALGLLLLFGLVRLPFERQITRDLHAAHFLEYQLNLDVRAQAGQMGFIAALSGYRAVVADYMWIEAYTAWSRTEWGRMKLLLDTTTALQPRAVTFWDQAAWHMAWNAATNALEDRKKEPREGVRRQAAREYILIGEQYLTEGLKYNPTSEVLWEGLGRLHLEKMHDPCRAAHDYAMASRLPGAFPYVKRAAAYYLARCPGHEREAYEDLLRLYQNEDERLPTLLKTLDRLQKELGVPKEQQIDITEDLKKATPH